LDARHFRRRERVATRSDSWNVAGQCTKENRFESRSLSKLSLATGKGPQRVFQSSNAKEELGQLTCSEWDASTQPAWLTSKVFSKQIQPLLGSIRTSAIRSRIGVSRWYASRVRQGYLPHPRHWLTLVQMVGLDSKLA
jgi:hypothetical protein